MKSKVFTILIVTLAAVLLSFGFSRAQTSSEDPLLPAGGPPLNDTFTYQGSLVENGTPADGIYDFEASIWDLPTGSTKIADCDTAITQDISVENGLFSFVCAPSTSDAFNGSDRYIEVRVKKNSLSTYTILPRQSITPVPYAWSLRPGATIQDATSTLRLNYWGSFLGISWKDGLSVSVTDDTTGVYGIFANVTNNRASEGDAIGLYGSASSANGKAYGVYASGDASNEVSGFFTNTVGVALQTESRGSFSLRAIRYSGSGSNLYAYHYSSGNAMYSYSYDGNGLSGNTGRSDHNYGLYTGDNLYSLNYHLRGAVMRVVQNGGSEALEAGDVVVFSGIGASPDGSDVPVIRVSRAATANSAAVAGVVYSRFNLAALPAADTDESVKGELTPAGPIQPGEYLLLVVEGPALVKVSALGGVIQPGDLLSTAGEAGYAGKAASLTLDGITTAAPGTVFGKALEALTEGVRLIYVYVTLQ